MMSSLVSQYASHDPDGSTWNIVEWRPPPLGVGVASPEQCDAPTVVGAAERHHAIAEAKASLRPTCLSADGTVVAASDRRDIDIAWRRTAAISARLGQAGVEEHGRSVRGVESVGYASRRFRFRPSTRPLRSSVVARRRDSRAADGRSRARSRSDQPGRSRPACRRRPRAGPGDRRQAPRCTSRQGRRMVAPRRRRRSRRHVHPETWRNRQCASRTPRPRRPRSRSSWRRPVLRLGRGRRRQQACRRRRCPPRWSRQRPAKWAPDLRRRRRQDVA